MYNISSKALEKLKKCSHQAVSISVNGISDSITLGMSDITEVPKIKRRSVTGDRIEIGAVTSSELKMALYNKDGRFDNFAFEGAEMNVKFIIPIDPPADSFTGVINTVDVLNWTDGKIIAESPSGKKLEKTCDFGRWASFPCREGEVYKVSGRSVYEGHLVMIFDGGGSLIYQFPEESNAAVYANERITIPQGAAEIVFNTQIKYAGIFKAEKLPLDVAQSLKWADGKIIKRSPSGKKLEISLDFARWASVKCCCGEVYNVSGRSAFDGHLAMVFDSGGNLIYQFPEESNANFYKNVEIVIPENGAEIIFNTQIKYADMFKALKISRLIEYVPMGIFTVDNQPRKLGTIQLKALDRMMRFSKPYDSSLGYPASLQVVLDDVCSKCSVVNSVDRSKLVNADYVVDKKPSADGLTYWQVLQMVAELNGVCAWINEDGHLKMSWYTDTDIVIAPSDRYSSDLQEQDIAITGVSVTVCEKAYIVGVEGYYFDLKSNLLIQVPEPDEGKEPDMDKVLPMLQKLAARVVGFSYRPYSCESKSLPHVWPMDKLTFTDLDGNSHVGIVTNNTWNPSRSKLAGKGKTATQDRYSTQSPFTPHQQAVIEQNKQHADKKLSDQQQAQLDLNEAIANSMGLYQTAEKQSDNSVKVYRHNKPLLEESEIIYTMTENGFAWTTTGWNNGEPVWQYGVSKDGNAILNAIYAYKLVADLIVAGRLQSKDGKSFFDLDNGLAQFLGEFTAKADSDDPTLGSSVSLKGFKGDFSNPDEPDLGLAGLVFKNAAMKVYSDLTGFSLGSLNVNQWRVLNENDEIGASITLSGSGVATAQDSTGSGRILTSGNLILDYGIVNFEQSTLAPGQFGGYTAEYPIATQGGNFSQYAVPIATAHSKGDVNVSCTKVDEMGNFTLYLHRPDLGPAGGTSVGWILLDMRR